MIVRPLFDLGFLVSFILRTILLLQIIQFSKGNYRNTNLMSEKDQKLKNVKDYSVIFIGQLGAVVCNIILNSKGLDHNYLVINACKQINQLSLLPVQSPLVAIKRDFVKKCDLDSGKIEKIVPDHNMVIMRNRDCYRYKYLVYTAGVEQWSDFQMIENLHQALSTKYSFVFSNVLKNQPSLSSASNIFKRFEGDKNVQRRRVSMLSNQKFKIKDDCQESINQDTQRVMCSESSINILFYIPCSPHAGYDNLAILYKCSQFIEYYTKLIQKLECKNRYKLIENQQSGQEQLQLNFLLLIEGEAIIPHSPSIDAFIKEKISQKGIKILIRHRIQKIDYLRRKIFVLHGEDQNDEEGRDVSISIKNRAVFSFDYLHVVIKQKAPNLLTQSGIDPYHNCGKTLRNSRYGNIFILGADIFPTTYSFKAVNYQAHTVAANIGKLLSPGKNGNSEMNLSVYTGYTQFFLWLQQSSYVKLYHSYSTKQNQLSISKLKSKPQQSIIRRKDFMKQQSNCWICFWESSRCRLFFQFQVLFYYNFKSYGSPFYFFIPETSENNVAKV